jgi:hypothetical protein
VSVVCCQVEVSALSRSSVQRSPTECGVSEYDCEALIMRRPWPTGGRCFMESKFENCVVFDRVVVNLGSLSSLLIRSSF